jgi:hypothetical protein
MYLYRTTGGDILAGEGDGIAASCDCLDNFVYQRKSYQYLSLQLLFSQQCPVWRYDMKGKEGRGGGTRPKMVEWGEEWGDGISASCDCQDNFLHPPPICRWGE